LIADFVVAPFVHLDRHPFVDREHISR
jgi:hypothetical protein